MSSVAISSSDADSGASSSEAVTANKCGVCAKDSKLRCSNCSNVFYCSVDHQRSHWKTHKKECHPFKICSNEKIGRYLVASRDIRPGEVVIKEAPLIRGPSQVTGPICVGCLKGLREDDEVKQDCESCGWPICERRECQNSKDHRFECALTVARGSKVSISQFVTPHPTYQCMTTLRCLLLKDNDPIAWDKLITLESHSEQRHETDQWRSDREGIAKFIHRFFKCEKWSEEEILKVCGIVQINGHEVPLTEPSHVAIYNNASMVEHSCKPNLSKSFSPKGEVLLWTTKAIRKGENLSICYSDVLWGTWARQSHLLQTKYFKCDCVRCIDVTELGSNFSAIKCNKKDANCVGIALPESLENWENNWRCRTCGHSIEYSYVANLIDRAGKDMEAMEKGRQDLCEKYVDHYSKWLPSHHYFIIDVKIALAQLIGSGGPETIQSIPDDRILYKIQLCKDLLKIIEQIAAVESRVMGSLNFELHTGLAEMGRRGAQNLNDNFRGALIESLEYAMEAVRLLEKEPAILPEGQIAVQAKINVDSLKVLLGVTAGVEI